MNHTLRMLFHCTPLTHVPSLCICGPSRFVCLETHTWLFSFHQGRTLIIYLETLSRFIMRHVDHPLPRRFFFLRNRPPAYEDRFWPPV